MTASVNRTFDGADHDFEVADRRRRADRFQMAVGWHDGGFDVPSVDRLLSWIVERGAMGSGEPDRISGKTGLGKDHEFRAGFRGGMDVPNDPLRGLVAIEQCGTKLDGGETHGGSDWIREIEAVSRPVPGLRRHHSTASSSRDRGRRRGLGLRA